MLTLLGLAAEISKVTASQALTSLILVLSDNILSDRTIQAIIVAYMKERFIYVCLLVTMTAYQEMAPLLICFILYLKRKKKSIFKQGTMTSGLGEARTRQLLYFKVLITVHRSENSPPYYSRSFRANLSQNQITSSSQISDIPA